MGASNQTGSQCYQEPRGVWGPPLGLAPIKRVSNGYAQHPGDWAPAWPPCRMVVPLREGPPPGHGPMDSGPQAGLRRVGRGAPPPLFHPGHHTALRPLTLIPERRVPHGRLSPGRGARGNTGEGSPNRGAARTPVQAQGRGRALLETSRGGDQRRSNYDPGFLRRMLRLREVG